MWVTPKSVKCACEQELYYISASYYALGDGFEEGCCSNGDYYLVNDREIDA